MSDNVRWSSRKEYFGRIEATVAFQRLNPKGLPIQNILLVGARNSLVSLSLSPVLTRTNLILRVAEAILFVQQRQRTKCVSLSPRASGFGHLAQKLYKGPTEE